MGDVTGSESELEKTDSFKGRGDVVAQLVECRKQMQKQKEKLKGHTYPAIFVLKVT